jgi:hypothetical protein
MNIAAMHNGGVEQPQALRLLGAATARGAAAQSTPAHREKWGVRCLQAHLGNRWRDRGQAAAFGTPVGNLLHNTLTEVMTQG